MIYKVNIYCERQEFMLSQAHEGDAGFDVHAIGDYTIDPGRVALIHTGIYMELPKELECQVRSRSGLALKHSVFVLNAPGTIDSSYRGECNVILANFGTFPFKVKDGDRVAQFVFNVVPDVILFPAASARDIQEKDTERGDKGFGSTGTEKLHGNVVITDKS